MSFATLIFSQGNSNPNGNNRNPKNIQNKSPETISWG